MINTNRALAPQSGAGILRDGVTLLVSFINLEVPWNERYPDGPYRLHKFRLDEIVDGSLGRSHGSIEIDAPSARIFPADDGERVYVVTANSTIYTLDTATLTEVAPRMYMPGVRAGYSGTRHKLTTLHAVISTDERYIVTNQHLGGDLYVADLVERRVHTIETGLGVSGGIALNRGWINEGLLALHARAQVLLYRIEWPSRLSEVARMVIPSPRTDPRCNASHTSCNGPYNSIAWSGSGAHLIAASDNASAEFVSLDVEPGSYVLSIRHWLTACPDDDPIDPRFVNLPNDILTTNGFVAPSPTPTEPITPEPPTPTGSPTALPSPPTPPSPPPSPSLSPPASSTPAMTAMPTVAATPSATPSPTRTAARPLRPIYLPLGLSESCPPKDRFNDIVFVLDASTSMDQRTPDGRRKYDIAREGIGRFIAGLRMAPGQDRVGVVAFNQDAWFAVRLTDDRALVERQLAAVAIAEQSRLDLGVSRAMGELLLRGRPGQLQSLIILSDGRVNPSSPDDAARAASIARRAGLTLYTVGIGPGEDRVLLAAMASGPARFLPASRPSDIVPVLADLVARVPCPPEAYWGSR